MDGVLIDSEPVWEEVRRGLVAERGGRWLADTQDRLMGMSTGEWSRYMSAELDLGLSPDQVADTVIAAMAARYARHLPLMPGAVDAVRSLARRWPLAVASSAPQSLIEVVLDASGLRSSFGVALSSELVPRGKPAPDVYLAVTERLEAPARQVRRDRGFLQRAALGRGRRDDGHRGAPSQVSARPRRARQRPRRAARPGGADPGRGRGAGRLTSRPAPRLAPGMGPRRRACGTRPRLPQWPRSRKPR